MTEFERMRGSSKAFLAFTLVIFILYQFVVLLRIIKTKSDKEVISFLTNLLGRRHNTRLLRNV